MSTEAAKKFLLEYAANPEAMRLLDEYLRVASRK